MQIEVGARFVRLHETRISRQIPAPIAEIA
jgi:hypothetical protein